MRDPHESVGDELPDQFGDIDDQTGSGLRWIPGHSDLAGAHANGVVQPTVRLAVDDSMQRGRRSLRFLGQGCLAARRSSASGQGPLSSVCLQASTALIAGMRPSPRRSAVCSSGWTLQHGPRSVVRPCRHHAASRRPGRRDQGVRDLPGSHIQDPLPIRSQNRTQSNWSGGWPTTSGPVT
jgi:hypothetical protein